MQLQSECHAKVGKLHTYPQPALTIKLNNMKEFDYNNVADLISAKTIFCTKEVLTSDEVAQYMGISKSYLYKLTMRQEIPHYKPLGKMCYFNRVEVENWLQSNRVATSEEINDKANAYLMKGGAK